MMYAEIVIPCFDEESGLPELIQECISVINASNHELGFILVDNGSKDRTREFLLKLVGDKRNFKIVELPENQGYGGGIKAGLEVSSAEIIGWTHADLQTPLIDCLNGLLKIKDGAEFVKGHRTGRKWSERFFSRGMSIFESRLFKISLEEINAQPTIFRRKFYEMWVSPPNDFSLDLYVLLEASRKQLEIRRICVRFLPRQFGHSKWNLGIISRFKFIVRTCKYSINLRKILNENL
ncbi:WcaA Glycosyltransferases involved in cell wall biogenesis [Candidatus Nanopelagicaceae bacterium]